MDRLADINRSRAPKPLLVGLAERLGIAAEGAVLVLIPLVAAALAIALGLDWLTIILLITTFAIAMFFRDPERTPPATEGLVLSAADGRVCEVGEGTPPGLVEGRFRRVSVFMSPLDVHVNRAPVGGEVLTVVHTSGEFRAAYSDVASERNERMLVVIHDAAGRRHAFVQVAGYLARRIVCRLRPHDRIYPGERVGLIMFGSRLDHFVPMEYRLTVTVGDYVRAGESVIGELTL